MHAHSTLISRMATIAAASAISALYGGLCSATPFFFSTGNPDGLIAVATRPDSPGKFEIEAGDDFVLTGLGNTTITSATFTGLLSGAGISSIGEVRVEIYRVFPTDSDVGRTPQVPTRVNSPSDVEFDDRDTASGNLTFMTDDLGPGFTANNSVKPGGIHPTPNQTTGGDGPVTGEEVEFDVTFTTPFDLPPGHYFFVPHVEVTVLLGDFFWLSAPWPIVPPGTPFPAGFTDLQSWTRDEFLDPDWLRVGTDIVGAGTFNATFSLSGTVPEPGTLLLLGAGLTLMWARRRMS